VRRLRRRDHPANKNNDDDDDEGTSSSMIILLHDYAVMVGVSAAPHFCREEE